MSRDAGGGGGACHGGNGKGPGGNKRANGAKSGVDMTAPTDEERRRLAWHLGRARMEDVTESVHEIDRRCPGALVVTFEAVDGLRPARRRCLLRAGVSIAHHKTTQQSIQDR